MLAGTALALGVAALALRSASALRIPARSVAVAPRSGHGFTSWPVANAAQAGTKGSKTSLADVGNKLYAINVTLGGAEFSLQLDTGSNDLVLLPDHPIHTTASLDMHPQLNATYGAGWMVGPVAWAPLQFGDYAVESQAYMNATLADSVFHEEYFSRGIRGIMGIAIGTSQISSALAGAANKPAGVTGNVVLTNVFLQNPELANITGVLLGRSDDGERTDASVFTIGEVEDSLKPQMDAAKPISVAGIDQWGVSLDGLTVNGAHVALKSAVKGAPGGKPIAVLDTGTSDAIVPAAVANAIYGAIEGAWQADDGTWIVPCLGDYPDVVFTFGGVEYGVHPLDLTEIAPLGDGADADIAVCVGVYSFIDIGIPGFDFLLGDSFMRNIYTVFDYGSFGHDGKVLEQPSVKIVSLADATKDRADFVTSRKKTLATFKREATKKDIEKALSQSNSANVAAAVADVASSGSSDGASYQALADKLDRLAPIVIGILGGILAVLLALVCVSVVSCIRGARSVGSARANPSYAAVPLRFKESDD